MPKFHHPLVVCLVGALTLFGGGFILGSTLYGSRSTPSPDLLPKELHEVSGTYTSPLLACDLPATIGSKEFSAYEQELSAHIQGYITSGKATDVAIYFRNLLDGAWFGINEKEKFTPASLLKVPVLIAVLKRVELDPSILTQTLKYDHVYDPVKPYFDSTEHLTVGAEYTVDALLSRMVKFSDNESMFLLRKNFDTNLVDTVYRDLKLVPPDDTYFNDFMTVKDYASFFRILFNSTYLSVPLSNKALELLASVEFKRGISADLPSTIPVAHKFGERTYTDDNSKQLHDCGIVYFPGSPYLLCVMTKGTNFDALGSVIREISKTIFQEIKTRSKEK